MNFKDQSTLLIPLRTKDTKNILYLWRPYADRFSFLENMLSVNTALSVIDLDLDENTICLVMKYLIKPIATIKNMCLTDLISFMTALIYLGIKNGEEEENSFEGFQFISDLIFQNFGGGLTSWDDFDAYATKYNKSLMNVTDVLWILQQLNTKPNATFVEIRTSREYIINNNMDTSYKFAPSDEYIHDQYLINTRYKFETKDEYIPEPQPVAAAQSRIKII